MAEPAKPDRETRDKLLSILGELIAKGGHARFVLPPVVPGERAFPEPWAPTKSGVALLLRRLAWYAQVDREIEIDDRRAAAPPPTERKPATRVELIEVRGKQACFALGLIGSDDVVGTLAHEIGVLFAVLTPPDHVAPYRTAEAPVIAVDHDRDGLRGAVATVYLGLGVVAANAAYQQYSRPGRFNGAYEPLEYEVLHAGALPMSSLAYLVAVQAIVRGERQPPRGLSPPQRDEVESWMAALSPERDEVCARLGVDGAALRESANGSREAPVAFADRELVPEEAPHKIAFRWQTNRGGVGFVAGTVLGIGIAIVASRGMLPFTAFGGATAGHLIGRRVRRPRCSACASIVRAGAPRCASCGASLRGDIAHLADRLEAEEQLENRGENPAVDVHQ